VTPTTPLGSGEEVVRVKTDGETVNVRALDVLPPGFATVTLEVPGEAMSLARIDAVNWDAPTNVVVRFDAFHRTVDPETKFEPFTVRMNPGPPALVELGFKFVNMGPEALTVRLNTWLADEAWG
jgi:hypothetical protein